MYNWCYAWSLSFYKNVYDPYIACGYIMGLFSCFGSPNIMRRNEKMNFKKQKKRKMILTVVAAEAVCIQQLPEALPEAVAENSRRDVRIQNTGAI